MSNDVKALLLLVLLLVQGLWFITESSRTSDEAAHLLAGYAYLTRADFRINSEEPPLIKELAALPLLILPLEFPEELTRLGRGAFRFGPAFVHENKVGADTLLLLGRLPILLLSTILGWSLYRWGRELVGESGALLALALYVLDPNIVAHSGLVTTDIGVTLFMFLALWALWVWSRRGAPVTAGLAGLSCGAAVASKFTAILFGPIPLVLALMVTAGRWLIPGASREALPDGPRGGGPAGVRRALVPAILLALGGACVAVAASYGIVGLPQLLEGVERGLRHTATGHTGYLAGAVSSTGWPHYFVIAYLLKTPPGTLLLLSASIVAAVVGSGRRRDAIVFLCVPVLVIFVITAFWRVNVGLRHVLPAFPFLYLIAGSAAGWIQEFRDRKAVVLLRAVVILSLAWNALEAFRIAPHHLAYFTPLAGGPDRGHLYLLDSNLDWGQSARALARHARSANVPVIYCAYSGTSDPGDYGLHYQYVPGIGNQEGAATGSERVPDRQVPQLLALSAMVAHLTRIDDVPLHDRLRHLPVVAMPGHSFLVYDISRDARAHALLGRLYADAGMWSFAFEEAARALRLDPSEAMARAVLSRTPEP